MSEWEVQLMLEAIKIAIFIAQCILLFFVIDRLRDVTTALEDSRQALLDLKKTLRRSQARPMSGEITDEGD